MLSIIIVNYNLSEEVVKSILSIRQIVKSVEYEIIVVDNNSFDKYLTNLIELSNKENNIKLVRNIENFGFGKACNIGANRAKGKYLLFLNPDTLIVEDFFSELQLILCEIKVGIIGVSQSVKIGNIDYSAGIFPNVFFEFLNVFFMGRILEALFMGLKNKLNSGAYPVDWVMGSFMLLKKEVFDKVNGFDEEYFLFFEEVDLCKRIKSCGYSIIYENNKYINHYGSKGAKKNYALFTKHFYESKKIYLIKHSNFFLKSTYMTLFVFQIISQIILWLLLSPLNVQKSKGKVKGFISVFRGMF